MSSRVRFLAGVRLEWLPPATGILLLAGSMSVGCGRSPGPEPPPPPLVVSASPLDVGIGSGGFCVAVEPTNARGVWWWQPGPSGCGSRSTGPGVFQGENGTVAAAADGRTVNVRFTVSVIRAPDAPGPPAIDVLLTLEDHHMRATATGAQVETVIRTDLDIPEA